MCGGKIIGQIVKRFVCFSAGMAKNPEVVNVAPALGSVLKIRTLPGAFALARTDQPRDADRNVHSPGSAVPLWNSDARSSAVAGIVLGPEARGASRRWDRRSAGAAAFLFSFALMRVNCPIDEGLHLFMWHLLPPLIGVVLSAGAGFLLFRKRSTAPTSFPRRGKDRQPRYH